MKPFKILLAVLITGGCALSAHAQKQLKYVPQALKGAKAVPYVVSPKLSPTVRAQFTVPVVRPQAVAVPNVSAAVERQVAATVTLQERIARLETNLKKLEEYARTHNNQLPPAYIRTETSNLRKQVIGDIGVLKRGQVLPEGHPLFQRYNQLLEAEQALQPTPQERIERLEANLNKLEEYVRTHDNRLPVSRAETAESKLRDQVIGDIGVLKRKKMLPAGHPLFQRYDQLIEAERALQPTPHERFERLERNLSQLEEYARTHDHHLPLSYSNIVEGSSVRSQVSTDIATLKRVGFLGEEHPTVQRYRKLVEVAEQQDIKDKYEMSIARAEQREQAKLAREEQELREKQARVEQREQVKLAREEQELREKQARVEQREQAKLARDKQQQQEEQFLRELRAQEQAAEERAWEQVLLQDKAWQAQPEDIVLDPTENAGKAAVLGEEQIEFPGTVPTDDYVNQLLRFYNKLDPMGTGTLQ